MLDITRHVDVFSPALFGERIIDIIGVGATGSRVAESIAKLGLRNIRVHDFDKVEKHNIPNQIYGANHVDQFKVDALKSIIKDQTGIEIQTSNKRVDGTERFGEIVFLLTDSMKSRKEIWKGGIRYKPNVKLMIETRMGPNNGRVYTINPSNPKEVRGWEDSLYGDDEAPVSECGTTITVGPTANIIAGMAVWQMIDWHQRQEKLKQGKKVDDDLDHEIMLSLQAPMIVTRNFSSTNAN